MTILVWWAVSAVAILAAAAAVGAVATERVTGLLIDSRGRYSLTQLQLSLWTVVVISLLGGVCAARLQSGDAAALDVTVPSDVLGLLGISLGSAVLATGVKTAKDHVRPQQVSASPVAPDGDPGSPPPPRFAQVFLLEEGTYANHAVDIAKFQNLIVTVVLVVMYVGSAVVSIRDAGSVTSMTTLPGLTPTFLTLLAISHGAYLSGKLPTQAGTPEHSVEQRNAEQPARRTPQAAQVPTAG